MIDIKRDSARSDKRTGGTIERAEFAAGEKNIRLTVNVPAFQMTFWQDGREIKTYPIGVGLKDYPIFVGRREIRQIIWNPVWIPPDSDWVAPALRGQIIKPTDLRNPLGKIKIPLGYGYLIHQAKGAQDLGNLVSHGCVRVLRDDLYDLNEKIIAAHELQVGADEIGKAKKTKETFVVELEKELPIEITYDTLVVEAGVLHIYPDIYGYKKNTVENLRDELKTNDVKTADIPEAALARMLARARDKTKYVISLEQIRAGKFADGETQAVIEQPRKRPAPNKRKSRR